MPTYPARALITTPIIKHTDGSQLNALYWIVNIIIKITAITATTTAIILYSYSINAFAPTLMADAISFMRSVPSSSLLTLAKLNAA